MTDRIVFLGPPASGKGTQAVMLGATLKIAHVSTGRLFREATRQGGRVGEACQKFIEKGQLVPDEMTIAVVRAWLEEHGRQPRFIFDGFPRTLPQAEALDAMLVDRGLGLPVVILLDLSEPEIIDRVLGRWGCENCGALYHGRFDPPRQTGVCDRCGGRLTQSADDTEATVRERMRVYRELTAPVVTHYERIGALRRVDGGIGKARVFAEVLRIVKT